MLRHGRRSSNFLPLNFLVSTFLFRWGLGLILMTRVKSTLVSMNAQGEQL